PDAGEIFFEDGGGEKCMFSKSARVNITPDKRFLGFVFQDFALWPHMTVFENVAFGLRARERGAAKSGLKERVESALAKVRLSEYAKRYPHQLSGGQQQRVAFARAMVTKPGCILFDEPLSALDAALREEMRGELKALVQEIGVTAIFVTHDQTEAFSMSDTIVVMNKGVIEQIGTPDEIRRSPASEFVAGFIGGMNKSTILKENQP
ncbi:MAG: ABC transporter ATP-binding protein, partial [Oscillospiraceae bacterium]|nr:ABC transporter ATP-binding protein [Oscillospiraceae bacterium]